MAQGFIYNDGGRAAAGFKGTAGDCVARAIAIASGKPYQEVYDAINHAAKARQPPRGKHLPRHLKSSSRTGVFRKVYEPYLLSLGFKWTPTMKIGSGCKVHLLAEELPKGRLVVQVSKHLTAMVDGIIHDTHDPRRGPAAYMKGSESGIAVVDHISPERCVYGYYTLER
jgi:hypothetical protein